MSRCLLLHVPYVTSVRNFAQSGALEALLDDFDIALVAPTRERGDLDAVLARWPGRVRLIAQESLFPPDRATALRRRWRTVLHGLSLELLRGENAAFRRQADRHAMAVKLTCRAPGAGSLWRALYPRLDGLVPGNPHVLAAVRDAKPDVVAAVACLADPVELDAVRAARELGIPSTMIVHSWDNPPTRGTPPVMPDRWIVWGPSMRDDLVRYHGVSPDDVDVAGAVQLAVYSDGALARCDRGSFLARLGLHPGREVVLYAATIHFPVYSDMPVLRLLVDYARLHPEVQVWFRPHPHSRELADTVPFARAHGLFIDPSFDAFLAGGLHDRRYLPDLDFYADMLSAADVVLSNVSTIALEGALVGRPQVFVGFDCPAPGAHVEVTQADILQSPQIQGLLREDGVLVSHTPTDLFSTLDRARALRGDAAVLERLRTCANRTAAVRDGKTFERLVEALRATAERRA
jgi:hypothetical protein